jgi:hypothetical protein
VAAVKFSDQREPTEIRGVQLAGERGDLRFEFFEGTSGGGR